MKNLLLSSIFILILIIISYRSRKVCRNGSLLSSLKAEIQDLNKVLRAGKVTGMVNSGPDVTSTLRSTMVYDLMVEVFGEKGKHARSAVGMGSSPGNMAVEIEIIMEG